MDRFLLLALLLGIAACNPDKPGDTGPEGDADADADTDADTDGPCETTVVETTPEDGTVDWYYRDPLEVVFSDPGTGAAIQVLDATGTAVAVTLEWTSEDHRVAVTPDPALEPSSSYTLRAEVCDTLTEAGFTTSAYGGDLVLDPADLVDRTYVIDFDTVEIAEPEGMGPLLALFGINPLLVGVIAADAAEIELVAAEGEARQTGGYRQLSGGGVWVFPSADFTAQPFFSADVDEIELAYQGAYIPVTGFHMEGTFATDGSSFGGGRLWGTADTRHVSEDYSGDAGYLCELAGSMGISCFACDDGEELCLFLRVEEIYAPHEDGLVIEIP